MDDLATIRTSLYETDFAGWALEQAAKLRDVAEGQGQAALDLDWANLAEEIEALARRDRRELASHLGTVLEDLLKLQALPVADPRGGRGESIDNARREIAPILADSPSLRRAVPDLVRDTLPGTRRAVQRALASYGESSRVYIELLDYSADKVTGDWWP